MSMTNINSLVDNTNQQSNYKSNQIAKSNSSVDYKYICIKKDVFDISMLYLNYLSLQKNKYIEIIYKSPSVFLEGLYFKTPPISYKDIIIYYKENKNYILNNYNIHRNISNASNTSNTLNPSLKLLLNHKEHSNFINILRSIDETISSYINKYSIEIENDLIAYYNDNRTISSFNYEQIIKFRSNNIIEIFDKLLEIIPINKLKLYNIIIGGDFNYDIKKLGYDGKMNIDGIRFHYHPKNLLTCCIKRRVQNDHVIDTYTQLLDIKIPYVAYMASDHKPILATLKC